MLLRTLFKSNPPSYLKIIPFSRSRCSVHSYLTPHSKWTKLFRNQVVNLNSTWARYLLCSLRKNPTCSTLLTLFQLEKHHSSQINLLPDYLPTCLKAKAQKSHPSGPWLYPPKFHKENDLPKTLPLAKKAIYQDHGFIHLNFRRRKICSRPNYWQYNIKQK